ncbi:pyridoxamine 5'-phosphate oxidase family protein [Clostridium gasigenes]|uniref:Pyridoxamine 5'-phosphate oxidase n=1 Tax=Clostridium gasigenes TaxID=94869 RepID=A0A1H0Q951_9CLOT|nr:pyridoxamine 5'-phosphate oxidase family protein [Clostridium gasigenes]MBB6623339.1 pyridoxamine 5'-phosphate oxidase family protein [Clostridium gasigenes]MBB6713243.1 pyridoxamine 5'-phosphate oxidase family protein [Clostridium gasigenes]MBU3088036.1 pyridoxamine 5'-phosphate oxidase family protein [Clostridium gasigenes]MBU3107889.1 pyridoxamine 5'-phosphate oxidase family protein [Clostridium gasigenes]SDP13877.1 Pyridoxamine 5'-phosphate oxidase [Clostridium gasigenes]
MLTEKFFEVIKHEGVVSIVTCGNNEVHASNTWNSYLVVVEGNKILIPAAAMIKTEENITINPKVKLTLGSKEVMGHMYMGTGFLLEGTAKFLKTGEHFNMMSKKYPFLTRVLEITVDSCKQTL